MQNVKSNNPLADQPGKSSRHNRRAQTSKKSDTDSRESQWVTGPNLRKMLDVSAVTLWRWRRAGGFPMGKRINGRLYFVRNEIETWRAAQADAA